MKKIILTLLAVLTLTACKDSNDEPANSTPNSGNITEAKALGESRQLTVAGSNAATAQNRIIYEMDLLSFTSQGTINAAQERLAELKSLGIDIVWLMPIHPRGDAKFATYPSPYAPKDYYAVWSKYGTLDDLKAFVSAAHQQGMQVWLDWVPNHTGTGAVWVTEHPEYYVWNGTEIKHPNDYSDVLQLAMKQTATQDAMIDAMKYWIDVADIDGYRCDYVSSAEIPADFWKRAIPELKKHKEGKNITIMGEADFAEQTRLYGCGFDFDYAWRFNSRLRDNGKATSAKDLITRIKNLYSSSRYKNDIDRMVYLTNHDDNENGKNYWQWMTDNVYLFTALQFTAYGMPLIYNGQEVGHRSIIYPWEKNTISWNSPNKKMQNTIATLCYLKHTEPALRHGNEQQRGEMRILNTDNDAVLAYERRQGDSKVITVLNLAKEDVTVNISDIDKGFYTLMLDSRTIAQGATSTPWQLAQTSTLAIEKKGYMIFIAE